MLHAVIMAGGSGTRFWPQSRRQMPKQFLRMMGMETLIQQAGRRCHPSISAESTWVVTGAAHAVETARQLPNVPAKQILVEPCGRNTAPCIGLAAIQLLAVDPDAVMLVMPADHLIQSTDKFQLAVAQAVKHIESEPDSLVLFGVEPNFPATGFGYIQRDEKIETNSCPMYRVKAFHEKPDLLMASRFMALGEYYWNCGIFAWRAQTIYDALKEFSPEIVERLERLRDKIDTHDWQRTLEVEFPQMTSISIDYAVLEKAARRVCVVEAPFDWDDVGTWQALPRLIAPDIDGNTIDGLCCAVQTEGCIIRSSEKHLIATFGINDLIIVHTPTATLVAEKRNENSLKKLLTEIEKRNLIDFL